MWVAGSVVQTEGAVDAVLLSRDIPPSPTLTMVSPMPTGTVVSTTSSKYPPPVLITPNETHFLKNDSAWSLEWYSVGTLGEEEFYSVVLGGEVMKTIPAAVLTKELRFTCEIITTQWDTQVCSNAGRIMYSTGWKARPYYEVYYWQVSVVRVTRQQPFDGVMCDPSWCQPLSRGSEKRTFQWGP